jgi:hypothetical protein
MKWTPSDRGDAGDQNHSGGSLKSIIDDTGLEADAFRSKINYAKIDP